MTAQNMGVLLVYDILVPGMMGLLQPRTGFLSSSLLLYHNIKILVKLKVSNVKNLKSNSPCI